MGNKYYTVPITTNSGSQVGSTGKTVSKLEKGQWIDAGMIAPKSGTMSVGIICSSTETNGAVNIWRGYVHGMDHIAEAWTSPEEGKTNIAITVANKFLRLTIIPPGHVNEGDYIGIRILNLEPGFHLDIGAIFIQYNQ
ncbi:MAG: hypothetical protein ACTSV2_06705 [Candidatus Thorarchaeota archaeon]